LDYNANERAIEVVDQQLTPLFQLIFIGPTRVAIRGRFRVPMSDDPGAFMTAVISEDGLFMLTGQAERQLILKRLLPIFKYPSWKHPGEFR
jgi:hypothetical protein